MKKIILASSSPRRKELLRKIVDDFFIESPNCEEKEYSSPFLTAKENAKMKAYAVSRKKDEITIGCDTVVALENKHFGKPYTRENAIAMINALKNKWHSVFTGVCVVGGKEYNFVEETRVFIKNLSSDEIARYVDNFRPFDKAGAYGIQDNIIVEEYKGDYYNIVGLPLKKLYEILLENDIDVKKNIY